MEPGQVGAGPSAPGSSPGGCARTRGDSPQALLAWQERSCWGEGCQLRLVPLSTLSE